MRYLFLVSLIWALSFGLIGNTLAGLDATFVATLRLTIALLVFLPCWQPGRLPRADALRLVGCGAIQFGLMYVCYMQAFRYLPSHLVALFSILTPVYVSLIHDLRSGRFHRRYLAAALLSVAGAAVILLPNRPATGLWTGFLLMQVAGLAFAFGQVYFREWQKAHPDAPTHRVFAWLYLGAVLLAILTSATLSDWSRPLPDLRQSAVILYLGVIASGLGFYLWNLGAVRSRPGTLAALNNAVVPLAMAASLFLFGESAQLDPTALLRLLGGGFCILIAVLIAEKSFGQS